jgi:hypothetical protein
MPGDDNAINTRMGHRAVGNERVPSPTGCE